MTSKQQRQTNQDKESEQSDKEYKHSNKENKDIMSIAMMSKLAKNFVKKLISLINSWMDKLNTMYSVDEGIEFEDEEEFSNHDKNEQDQ